MSCQEGREPVSHRLGKFDKCSKVVKIFNPFGTREQFGCPLREEVNTYAGCSYGCVYCYGQWIPSFCKPRPKKGFIENLEADLELIQEYQLEHLPISISNSTEPFQPLEDRYHHTQKLLEKLAARDLKVVIITKNPSLLLTEPYLALLDPPRVYVQVSIPFLYNRSLEPRAPQPKERIKAVTGLVEEGFKVAVRIDPLIPKVSGIEGQSEEELQQLVGKLQEAGVSHIISKSLRLVGAINKRHPNFYQKLKTFFRQYGSWQNNCYELSSEAKTELLMPVYKACQREGLQLATCYERHEALPETFRCDGSGQFFAHGGGMDKEPRSQEEKVQLKISR